ncbi:MAG: hypothetical protein AAF996_03660 [Pseudomonadota bacterium]
MRTILIAVAGMFALVSCAESADVSLSKSCNAVMSDPDVQRDIVEANVSLEDYCACASQQILALPDAQRDTTILALETMETLMAENNGSTEAAFRALSDAGRADDASAEAVAAYESVDELGEQLEDVLDAMREAGGVCPA